MSTLANISNRREQGTQATKTTEIKAGNNKKMRATHECVKMCTINTKTMIRRSETITFWHCRLPES